MARRLYLVRHGEAVNDGALSKVGRHQARLAGERLNEYPIGAVYHSPLPRAAQTARLIGEQLPQGVRVEESDLIGDYTPAAPRPDELRKLPAVYTEIIAENSPEDLADGARRAAAALDRFASATDDDTSEVLVTHNQIVAWFVLAALGAPAWRWMGLNHCNGAISTLLFRPGRPGTMLRYNDQSHLPTELRWTGFPPELRD
jgi:serine/threonine-protein phosphatase PGAM5